MIRTFEQIRRINEGVWAIKPENKAEAIERLEELKKWMYNNFGCDHLFNNLDNSIMRIREMTAQYWWEKVHGTNEYNHFSAWWQYIKNDESKRDNIDNTDDIPKDLSYV